MYRMEGNVVNSKDQGLILEVRGSIFSVTLEREVAPKHMVILMQYPPRE
jgi:hypothetical protein